MGVKVMDYIVVKDIERLVEVLENGLFLEQWREENLRLAFNVDKEKVDYLHETTYKIRDSLLSILKDKSPLSTGDISYKELFLVMHQFLVQWVEEGIETDLIISYIVSFFVTFFSFALSNEFKKVIADIAYIILERAISTILSREILREKLNFCSSFPVYELGKENLISHLLGEPGEEGIKVVTDKIMDKIINGKYKRCIVDVSGLIDRALIKNLVSELEKSCESLRVKLLIVTEDIELNRELSEFKGISIVSSIEEAIKLSNSSLHKRIKKLFKT